MVPAASICNESILLHLEPSTRVFKLGRMPTVLREGPDRFFFCSCDGGEPPPIHVQHDDALAKFWLDPIRCDYSAGYRPAEIRRIQAIIETHRNLIADAWNDHFGQ